MSVAPLIGLAVAAKAGYDVWEHLDARTAWLRTRSLSFRDTYAWGWIAVGSFVWATIYAGVAAAGQP